MRRRDGTLDDGKSMGSRLFAGRFALPVTVLTSAVVSIAGVSLATSSMAGTGGASRAAAHCASCGHNLIKNAGAEACKGANADVKVKVPGWKATKNFTAARYTWSEGDLSPTTHGPKHRGKNYFYGGPDSTKSSGLQIVTVAASGVSGGKVTYKLSGWLGGYSTQGDRAILDASFEKANGTVLATTSIGPVSEAARNGTSELLPRSTSGKVPAGTRRVALTLVMSRGSGSDNDGMADNLSLVFSAK
jgi:hypothetical protein